jgi:hypothetical protein
MPFVLEQDGQEIAKFYEKDEAVRAAQKRSKEVAEAFDVYPCAFQPLDPHVVYACDCGAHIEVVFRVKTTAVGGAEAGGATANPSSGGQK